MCAHGRFTLSTIMIIIIMILQLFKSRDCFCNLKIEFQVCTCKVQAKVPHTESIYTWLLLACVNKLGVGTGVWEFFLTEYYK